MGQSGNGRIVAQMDMGLLNRSRTDMRMGTREVDGEQIKLEEASRE